MIALEPIATGWDEISQARFAPTGVLASVFAVAISMWSGINTNLLVAIVCYALLTIPARILRQQLD